MNYLWCNFDGKLGGKRMDLKVLGKVNFCPEGSVIWIEIALNY